MSPLISLAASTERCASARTSDEAGDAFYPTSLGPGWRRVVDGWDEESRADFAYEIMSLDRIRRSLRGVELGDINTAAVLMTELSQLSPPLDQYAERAIGHPLEIVQKTGRSLGQQMDDRRAS
jgi:hypothetical protein